MRRISSHHRYHIHTKLCDTIYKYQALSRKLHSLSSILRTEGNKEIGKNAGVYIDKKHGKREGRHKLLISRKNAVIKMVK